MRRLVLLLAFTAVATGTAGAEPGPLWGVPANPAPPPGTARAEPAPPSDPGTAPGPGRPIAFAVNVPFAWPWSLAFSAWVGMNDHQAIRANYARYRGPLRAIIPGKLVSEGPEEGDIPPDFGHTTDLSVSWVYFPRRVLDGATFEVSALLRLNRLRDRIDSMNVASEEVGSRGGAHAPALSR